MGEMYAQQAEWPEDSYYGMFISNGEWQKLSGVSFNNLARPIKLITCFIGSVIV